jgi:hypothetical protein
VKVYGHFRNWLGGVTVRQVEQEFLANKRALLSLPRKHSLSAQDKKDQRFSTWALRQTRRQLAALREKMTSDDGSASDVLSSSDPNRSWKRYGIVVEDDTRYLIAWEGVDKKTGQAYGDEWTVKEDVDEEARHELETYKTRKARRDV